MDQLLIRKNKGESFKCQIDVDGVSMDEVNVRLCLEFDDNKNMFFNGNLEDGGKCMINIPPLNEVKSQKGKLRVEAIADATYFSLYECEFDLKPSVQVKMTESNKSSFLQRAQPINERTIRMTQTLASERVEDQYEDQYEEQYEEPYEEPQVIEPEPKKVPNFRRKKFDDFISSRLPEG